MRQFKKLYGVLKPKALTWVGDGLPVRNLFGPADAGAHLNPFLLLDYAAPYHFDPAETPRGIEMHPHRGFETVTLVYQGGIAHRDSDGSGGTIAPGGVQWMTAGSGVMHEELHSAEFTRTGGTLEAVQLWVNLPRKDKWTAPFYQTKEDAELPRVPLADAAGAAVGSLRVVAGEFGGQRSPINNFLRTNVWDVSLGKARTAAFDLEPGWGVGVLLRRGQAKIAGATVDTGEMAVLQHGGTAFDVVAHSDVEALVLAAPFLDEPIVARGPFVVSTDEEMKQTRQDYRDGVFHRLKPAKKC